MLLTVVLALAASSAEERFDFAFASSSCQVDILSLGRMVSNVVVGMRLAVEKLEVDDEDVSAIATVLRQMVTCWEI